MPLILGLVLAVLAGVGGFYAAFSGLIMGAGHDTHTPGPEALPDIAYVGIDPLVISLAPSSTARHLRFAGQIEVEARHKAEVALLLPRVLDLLNGYLRAVDPKELEAPAALIRLRAQMLRRIQIITGEGRVRDLLITEFVLN